MPKCVLRRAETMPMPDSRAMAIASAMARVAPTIQVARQSDEAVRVDAAQIGANETGGNGRRVTFGHAVRGEQSSREGIGCFGSGVEARRFAHRSSISRTCLALSVAAPSRKARSVPVET